MSLRIRDVEKGFPVSGPKRALHEPPLTWTTQIELFLEVDVAHEFVLAQILASGKQPVDLPRLISKEIGDSDLSCIWRGEDFDAGDIPEVTLGDGAAAAVANVGNHCLRVTSQAAAAHAVFP